MLLCRYSALVTESITKAARLGDVTTVELAVIVNLRLGCFDVDDEATGVGICTKNSSSSSPSVLVKLVQYSVNN